MPKQPGQNQRIETKLDSLSSELSDVSKTLVKQQVILEEHVKRSLINEEAIGLMRQEIEPLKKHVSMYAGAFKAFMAVAAIGGAIASILKLVLSWK